MSGSAGSSWAIAASRASARETRLRELYTALVASVSGAVAMATPRAATGSGSVTSRMSSRTRARRR